MIGLKRGTVKLLPYDAGWAASFQAEKKLLEQAIGAFSPEIRHIGSTSIPGAFAKPVIDIAIGVSTLIDGLKFVEPLVHIGYEYRGEAGVPGRHFFAKGSEQSRTHYLHVEEKGGKLWADHIHFRNFLLYHDEYLQEYNVLKQELAARYPNDRDSYSAGKEEFISRILKLSEYKQT